MTPTTPTTTDSASTALSEFLSERAAIWDDTGDYSPGSPFDLLVIQPTVQRLGADPFAVDFFTFAQQRINEAFPDVPTSEGDAITDLLIKIGMLLLDPIVREIIRVKAGQSFQNPNLLTIDEAQALGANLFSQMDTGQLSRGTVRIFFAQAQNVSVSPANFCISKTGLHFSPTQNQSISVNDILYNKDASGDYYFDVTVIAEQAGDEYNIDVGEIVTIANMPSAVRITNLARFRFGLPAETAVQYIDRTEQELTERSMVTLRGINARVTGSFPEVSQIGVVGFNDPEMERDIVEGGGLGAIKAMGNSAVAIADGSNMPLTRRFDMSVDLTALSTDFNAIIGPTNVPPSGWVLTLVNLSAAPYFQDVDVKAIVSPTQLDLAQQVMSPQLSNPPLGWTIRKRELTLSKIPGGILFPDGPNGTVDIPDDTIHIGGATDTLVRGAALDSRTLVIEDVADDSPLLQGIALSIIDTNGDVSLGDMVLDVTPTYLTGGAIYEIIANAGAESLSLQILDNPVAGTYRVLSVIQVSGAAPVLTLDPPPLQAAGNFRWRLVDNININLVEPKETRVAGATMVSVQGVDLLVTAPPTDFSSLGVSVGDVVRLTNGADKGDFKVKAVLPDEVQVDRVLTASASGLSFIIFRANPEGGATLPLIRITDIELLDPSGQPVGAQVPFANPVFAQGSAFANFAHGVIADVFDALLGIVSLEFPNGANVSGLSLFFVWETGGPQSVIFSGANPIQLDDMINQINTALGMVGAYLVNGNRLGITILGGTTQITGGSARPVLFGTPDETRTSQDIRSPTIDAEGGWSALTPAIDTDIDVAQVLDGFQIGFYAAPAIVGHALITAHDFAPEATRHVQVGSRSVGTVRVFFLQPTSVSFDKNTLFSTKTAAGIPLNFLPDPTVKAQRIPALPSGAKPMDAITNSLGNTLTSASVNFLNKGIQPGDELVIDFIPLTGTIALTDPVSSLATNPLTYLQLTVNNVDWVVNFVNDSTAIPPHSVTRDGVPKQINQVVGQTICSIVSIGGSSYLQFNFNGSVIVRKTGTANPLLGFSTSADQNNESPHAGTYVISQVADNQVTISTAFPNNPPAGQVTNEQYSIFRPGLQRICSTQMNVQKGDASLYYVDVDVVSQGTGDLWNIGPNTAMTVTGYQADGYWLTTNDPDLTFSVVEPLYLHLSRTILQVGVSDDLENATQLSGQNIQVTYDQSSLVANVSNFVTAETERVICESPLARHLIPYFVRFNLVYTGGSTTDVTVPAIDTYVTDLLPSALLQVSDLEAILSGKGATSITNPVTLVAIIHNFDRTVTAEWSQNYLNTGRLAAFIPDVINVTRNAS